MYYSWKTDFKLAHNFALSGLSASMLSKGGAHIYVVLLNGCTWKWGK